MCVCVCVCECVCLHIKLSLNPCLHGSSEPLHGFRITHLTSLAHRQCEATRRLAVCMCVCPCVFVCVCACVCACVCGGWRGAGCWGTGCLSIFRSCVIKYR